MEENKNIKKAIDELEQVSGNARLRRIAELKEKYIRDEQSSIEYAQDEGFKLGEAKGEKNKSLEIAKNMLKENSSIGFISKVTGLSLEEIEALK